MKENSSAIHEPTDHSFMKECGQHMLHSGESSGNPLELDYKQKMAIFNFLNQICYLSEEEIKSLLVQDAQLNQVYQDIVEWAGQGVKEAEFAMGVLHHDPYVEKRSDMKQLDAAIGYFTKAAEKGVICAANYLYRIYSIYTKDYEKVLFWALKAVSLGSVEARGWVYFS